MIERLIGWALLKIFTKPKKTPWSKFAGLGYIKPSKGIKTLQITNVELAKCIIRVNRAVD